MLLRERNMLDGRGVEHQLYAPHGLTHALEVSHISQEEPQTAIWEFTPQLDVLLFIAAIHDDLACLALSQTQIHEGPAKRPGAASHEHSLVREPCEKRRRA